MCCAISTGRLRDTNGRKVTCFPGTESKLTGANVSGSLIEVDGNIITGKGPGAALAFSLMLAEKLIGRDIANELKNAMIAG